MNSLPFTLTKPDPDARETNCTKCLKLKREAEDQAEAAGKPAPRVNVATATHVLCQGAFRWPLCNNHSAHASWTYGLPHLVFNPRGETLKTAKKE